MPVRVIGDWGIGSAAGGSTLLTGLVSSWKLADTNDELGTNNLTNFNAVSFANDGKIGKCATFVPASTQNLYHADGATIQVGDEDFSFAFWAKFNDLTTGIEGLITKWGGNPSNCFAARKVNNEIRWFVGGGETAFQADIDAGMTTGVWYALIVIHDSVNDIIQIWMNNSYTPGPVAHTLGAPNDDARFSIGSYDDGTGPANIFNGAIDNVSFWRKVLSSTERAEWYNAGTGKEYPF